MSPSIPESLPEGFDPTQSMELVWQGQKGDANAVNELFVRYLPRMRRYLNVRIPVAQRPYIDPEDVLQETLIVATRRLPELELRSSASIKQWLSKIAEHKISERREYLQAERRNPAKERPIGVGVDSEELGGLQLPSHDPTPSQFFARNEMEQLMDQQLRDLEPEEYREVILERDYLDADWETIRTRFGRPTVEAAQDLYHRAHKRWHERISRHLG
jgi:RNA polymerase sigma-70 factor, ECF subfamily